MPVNAADLPPKIREQIERALAGKSGDKTTSPKKKPSRAGVGLTQGGPGTCGCGERFPNANKWEKHAAVTGCTRWDCDLSPEPLDRSGS